MLRLHNNFANGFASEFLATDIGTHRDIQLSSYAT
jgi:hypothetical protein